MALKKRLLWVLVAWLPFYSYCDEPQPYSGLTGNAVTPDMTWVMQNVLPTPPGLDINAVIYNYTLEKAVDQTVVVTVQNEDAVNGGYIFQEVDTWSPNSLTVMEADKVVPVIPMNREYWGDGSITVEGNGVVSNAKVYYSYIVDPCYDPQFSPNCPGYEAPVYLLPELDISYYDATKDPNVILDRSVDKDLIKRKDLEEESEEESEEERAARLEKALAAADASAMFAQGLAQAQMLAAMNSAVGMNSYYEQSIAGGVYNETVSLNDKQLPENKRGLRAGLAQQILHDKMIEMQYNRN